jgi:hypothetical protein
MSRQRATDRLATGEAPNHATRLIGLDASSDRLLGGIGLKLFELQFRLFQQFAAMLRRGAVTVMFQLWRSPVSDEPPSPQRRRPGLGLSTCRSLGREFNSQRIDTVGNRIGGVHPTTKESQSPVAVHEQSADAHRFLTCQPAISGRQVRCGCLQSIPSNM